MLSPSSQNTTGEIDPLMSIPFVFSFVVILLGMLAWLIMVAYGLFAAVMALQGRDFKYIIIGKRLEAYLARM
jgi:hypothetical protein